MRLDSRPEIIDAVFGRRVRRKEIEGIVHLLLLLQYLHSFDHTIGVVAGPEHIIHTAEVRGSFVFPAVFERHKLHRYIGGSHLTLVSCLGRRQD